MKRLLFAIVLFGIASTSWAGFAQLLEANGMTYRQRKVTVNRELAATSLTTTNFKISGVHKYVTASATALTTNAQAITVTGKAYLTISADKAVSATTISGGCVGQTVILQGTSDTNTVRIDASSALDIGANVTLGNHDILCLFCYETDKWLALYKQDN